MTWKVLVTAPYMQPVIERFRPLFLQHDVELIVPPVEERFEEEDLLQWISEVDGVICGDDRFTERVLTAAPKLKVLSKWGTGIDSIDQQACKKLGIAVRNTPDAFSQPVADSIMGYILCFARNLPWMDQAMRRGIWKKIPGRSLSECVLGVIGVGNVGKALVRRAVAHGMHVLGNDLVEMPKDFLEETSIEMTSKEKLLGQSDFVSLNCDLNPTSYYLMNGARFAQMKDTAIVINTARGPVVREEALIRASAGRPWMFLKKNHCRTTVPCARWIMCSSRPTMPTAVQKRGRGFIRPQFATCWKNWRKVRNEKSGSDHWSGWRHWQCHRRSVFQGKLARGRS
jgi:D-3-phosphoglycerate dehydrogenase